MEGYKIDEDFNFFRQCDSMLDDAPYFTHEDVEEEDEIEITKEEFINICNKLEEDFIQLNFEGINEGLKVLSRTKIQAIKMEFYKYFIAIRLYEKLNDVIDLCPPSGDVDDQSDQVNIQNSLEIISYYSRYSAQMAIGFTINGITLRVARSFHKYTDINKFLALKAIKKIFMHKFLIHKERYGIVMMNAAHGILEFLIDLITNDLKKAEEFTPYAMEALINVQFFASLEDKIIVFQLYNQLIMDDKTRHLMGNCALALRELINPDHSILADPGFEAILSTISRLMFFSVTDRPLQISFVLATWVIPFLNEEHLGAFMDCMNYGEISRSIKSSDAPLTAASLGLLCAFVDATPDVLVPAFETDCISNMMDIHGDCDAQLGAQIMELACRILCVGTPDMAAYILDSGLGPDEIVGFLSVPGTNPILVLKALHRAAILFPLFREQLGEDEDLLEELREVAEGTSSEEKDNAEETEVVLNELMNFVYGSDE